MHKISGFKSYKRSHSGDDSNEDPPVPIPNTEVKLVVLRAVRKKAARCGHRSRM